MAELQRLENAVQAWYSTQTARMGMYRQAGSEDEQETELIAAWEVYVEAKDETH